MDSKLFTVVETKSTLFVVPKSRLWKSEVRQGSLKFKFTVISSKIQYLLKFTIILGKMGLLLISGLGKGINVDDKDLIETKATVFSEKLVLLYFGVITWFWPETWFEAWSWNKTWFEA